VKPQVRWRNIMAKVAVYFESSLKLQKKVKSAMTYPVSVITMAVGLVSILLIKVIPVFEVCSAVSAPNCPRRRSSSLI